MFGLGGTANKVMFELQQSAVAALSPKADKLHSAWIPKTYLMIVALANSAMKQDQVPP